MEAVKDTVKDSASKALAELRRVAAAPREGKLDSLKCLVRKVERSEGFLRTKYLYAPAIIPPVWHLQSMIELVKDKNETLKFKLSILGENMGLYAGVGGGFGIFTNMIQNANNVPQIPVLGGLFSPVSVGVGLAAIYAAVAPFEWWQMESYRGKLREKAAAWDNTGVLQGIIRDTYLKIPKKLRSGFDGIAAKVYGKVYGETAGPYVPGGLSSGWDRPDTKLAYFARQYHAMFYLYAAWLAVNFSHLA